MESQPNNLLASINERIDTIKAMQEKIAEEMRNSLYPVFSKFFEKYPEVHKITWVQYTPYFNDGDPCVFGVYESEFELISNDITASEALTEDFRAVSELIETIDATVMESWFGDHAEVTVTRDGITVDEYEHD